MARQGQVFLLGVVLYFFIRSSLIGSEELDGTSFTQVPFHKLEGQSLKTISVRSVIQCCMRCERVPECLSFNVAAFSKTDGSFECVLLKNHTSDSWDSLVPTQEYHHYTRLVPDPCLSIPRCKNGGTCEAMGNDFRCHCPQGFTGKTCSTCNIFTALGMESDGAIPDSSITASSSYSVHFPPLKARLRGDSAWIMDRSDSNPWLQVDLSTVTKVTQIATQGSSDGCMKTYSLQYGLNSSYFEDYEGGKILVGNKDANTVVKNVLQPVIIARFVRVLPKTWNTVPALRMELYRCRQGR